ncbi:MAG: futalosine hydrolase [Desulfuromonadaceae bacterium]|nr:futalosine hydrolase [Desulfuromonadaceae bacterium]
MILLLSAVTQENVWLRAQLQHAETHTWGPLQYQRGTLGAHDVALATTGISTANAAGCSAMLLHQLQPSAVILCGCGGAYHGSGLKVGDLALARAEIYADTGAITSSGFLTMRDLNLPLLHQHHTQYYNHFPVCTSLRECALPALQKFAAQQNCTLEQGNFVTVATCSGTNARATEVLEATAGICENMEGAAIAHMCCMFDIPFIEVRAISNMVEARDMAQWDLPGAMLRAQEAVLFWLRNIPVENFTPQER